MITVTDLPKYQDHRGFITSFWTPKIGEFVEDRYSFSTKHVLRGLHGDRTTGKLIVLVQGEVEFFSTSYCKDTQDFGKHTFLRLSGKEPQAIFVPAGYLNGHLCLSEECVFLYKWSDYYKGPENQVCVFYKDEDLGIPWSVSDPILSERDKTSTTKFKEIIYEN